MGTKSCDVSYRVGPTFPGEHYGGSNPSEPNVCDGSCGQPIDTLTGNFWHTFDDLLIPGRGPALHLTRTYNSQAAAAGATGPFGPGWSFSYGMSLLIRPGAVTVTQENGSQVPFARSGSSWTSPPHADGMLTQNADGTWTYVRRQTKTFTFNAQGQLTVSFPSVDTPEC
jgi:hypothetical protein